MSANIFQQFYPELIKTLPMNDATFRGNLFKGSLLPGDLKEHIESLNTSVEKASYFLDHVIKPSIMNGDRRRFDELLSIMVHSDYKTVKELAISIRDSLEEQTHDTSVHTTELYSQRSVPTVKLCPLDVSGLKVRYRNQLPPCKTGWPKHNVFHYVRLAIVEKEDVTLRDRHLNEITKLTLKGAVDQITKKKTQLGDLKEIFHYDKQPCPRLILIMGGPGIGKTTLANEICIRWARDGFLVDEFDAVILIPLRSVQQRSLEQVMEEYVGEEDYPKLKKSKGSKCLLILEGLDEMALSHRQSDETLRRLTKDNTLLEKAKILITSRPHACKNLVVHRTVEVVGFGDKQIREFVGNSFPNDLEAIKEFMRQLTEFPQLHSLCYVPLNVVMIIDIFRFSENKLPSTLTELYQLFIAMILQREVKRGSVNKLTVSHDIEVTLQKLLDIPKEAVGAVYLLCKLAYYAFFKSYSEREEKDNYDDVERCKNPKIIFTESDLTDSGIEVTSEFEGFGLLKATHVHKTRDTVTYNFLHLTVQEFLCSLYMSTLSQQEQLNLLSEHFIDYPNVMIFLCGLTRLASNEMIKFLHSKLNASDDQYLTTVIRCIYESNHSDPFASQTTAHEPLKINFSTLLPYDCMCLSWLLSCYPVSELDIENSEIGDIGAKLLVRHYPNKNTTGQLLEVLNIWGSDLTIAGLKDVMKIVRTSSTTLKVLHVGGNKFGEDGILMILEEFQHNNSLIDFSVERSGLSVKGATAVSKLLMRNHSLEHFHVSNNNIDDDGISVIVEQLQHITTLTTLYVGECGLSVKGATAISKLLKDNHVIQKLWMNNNNIGDDGITAIATALTNSTIRELWVYNCGITLTGARSIATLLSVNHSIRTLRLQNNLITTQGAYVILQSAVNNEASQVDIHIDDDHTDSEVRRMQDILDNRERIQTNEVTTAMANTIVM